MLNNYYWGKLSGISGNIDFKATGPPADIPIAIMSNFLSLSFFISFSFNIFSFVCSSSLFDEKMSFS